MAQNPAPKSASTLTVSTAMSLGGASLPTAGVKFSAATPAVVTSTLYSPDGAAVYFNGSPLATGSSISGTTGKLAKFTAATTLGDSIITESGTTATVANTLNATTLGGTLSTAAQPNITSVGTLTGGATGAGFTIAIGTSTVTGTIPSANVSGSYTSITGVGTLTAGATGAGFTIALSTSTVTGLLSTTRGGTNQDTSGSTGVAQVAAGTWSVSTTLQNAVQDNITRTGALNVGSITSGFGSINIGADSLTAGTGSFSGLGVGTASPNYTGELVAASAGATVKILGLYNNASATVNSATMLVFEADRQTSGRTEIAGITGIITDIDNTNRTGELHLGTTSGGAITTRMRIFGAGGVSIGDATDPGTTNFRVAGTSTLVGATTSASFIPTSSSVPTNGMYLSAANTVAFATNTTLALSINSSQAATFVGSVNVASTAVTVRNGTGGSTSTGASVSVIASDMGGGGAQSGHTMYVGRNSNATPAAGSIGLEDLNGVPYFIWIDGAGKVRVNTSAPTNAGDTSGTIIGTQT